MAYCKSGFFCGYGKAGLNALKEYVKAKNLDIPLNNLELNFIKYDSYNSFMNLPEEFFNMLKILFSDKVLECDIEEVKLAHICYTIMEQIKPSMKISHSTFQDIESKCFKLLENECLKNNKVVNVDISNFIPKDVQIDTILNQADKKDFFDYITYCLNEDKLNKTILDTILEIIEIGYVKKTW